MKISEIRDIKIESFDYPLPDDRIARHPMPKRDECRLILSRPDGGIQHFRFNQLAGLLPFSGLMVCNNTRVINARIRFRKPSGANIEVFLLEPLEPSDYVLAFQQHAHSAWACLVGNLKRWKDEPLSKDIHINGQPTTLTARRLEPMPGNAHRIIFEWNNPEATWADVVEAAGYIPIPPYLRRDTEDCDSDDYQTVYSRTEGSVAAPTAGLHFTSAVLDDIRAHNIDIREVTLHVGAGTFQPVKSETIGEHPMHTETFSITLSLIRALREARASNRTITAVGTTTVRTLESLPYLGRSIEHGSENLRVEQWEAYQEDAADIDTDAALAAIEDYMTRRGLTSLTASTAIMIAPGFRWRLVGCMVTNFHQPQSTLLLLVSSFLNRNADPASPSLQWRRIYNAALQSGYRFLSYGDACLLFPKD